MKLYGCTGRSDRIKAAAGWAGVPLEVVQPFVMGVDNKTPEFLAKNPFGKVPVLETPEGACIFESNAIARFLVSSKPCALYPADAAARAKIDAWCDAFNALDCVGPQWFYPIVGIGADRGITHDPNAEAAAKTTVAGFLKTLEATLGSSPHLTGDAVTLADVIGACALQTVYSALYAPADWKPFPAVLKWIETVYAAPEFVDSVGVVPKCEKAMVFDPAGPQAMPRPAAPAAGTVVDVNGWPATRIRQTFIDFFVKTKQHVEVPSSPVVPHDDPTLLFANAGMNQFKPIFLGKCDPKSPLAKLKRACDTQKCIRAGGKHNDLDDVGKDTYHHTFFEMLGNWSFGDFFKREAIHFAWDAAHRGVQDPPDRLYATYFGRRARPGSSSGSRGARHLARGAPRRARPSGQRRTTSGRWATWARAVRARRFTTIASAGATPPTSSTWTTRCASRFGTWCSSSSTARRGVLKPLPAKHVDTGMGFERIASILQGKMSNYDTDIFMPIFDQIQKITGAPPYAGLLGAEDKGGEKAQRTASSRTTSAR